MCSAPAGPLALPPGKTVLLLPQRASSPAMSSQSATSPVAPCPIPPAVDPLVLEHLTVWDPEDSGNRHWDEKTQTLHIVQTEDVDRVRITYTGPNSPAKLEVTRNGEPLPALAGGGDWTAQVTYASRTDPYGDSLLGPNPFPRLFTALSPVCTYTFTAPQFTVTVKVYNPDQWKLKVTIPPMKSQSFGRKSNLNEKTISTTQKKTGLAVSGGRVAMVSETTTSTLFDKKNPDDKTKATIKREAETVKIGMGGKTTTREHNNDSYFGRASKLRGVGWKDGKYTLLSKDEPKLKNKQKPKKNSSSLVGDAFDLVKLECNTETVVVDTLTVIAGALDLARKIRGIFKYLKNAVPQVGWTWDFDFKIFEGSLELSWGWREAKGSGVVYGISAEADLVIIEGSGSLGVGVSAGDQVSAKATLTGTLTGTFSMKVGPVEYLIDSGKGDLEFSDLFSLTGVVHFTVQFDLGAGSGYKVTAGGTGNLLNLTAVFKAGGERGLSVETQCSIGGIEVFYAVKSTYLSRQKKFTWIEPLELGKITLPGPGNPSSGELNTRGQVKERAKSVLDEGWFPLDFHETVQTAEHRYKNVFMGERETIIKTTEETVALDTVAGLIADRIWARKDRLDLGIKVIEGILYDLRDRLKADGRHVNLERLKTVLSSPQFSETLDRAECPVKCCMIDYGLTSGGDAAGA